MSGDLRFAVDSSENDIWIAAICLQHGLKLLTLDRHFDRIDGLELATA